MTKILTLLLPLFKKYIFGKGTMFEYNANNKCMKIKCKLSINNLIQTYRYNYEHNIEISLFT